LAETRNYLITHRVNNGVKIFHLNPFPSAVTRVRASTLISHDLKHKPQILRWWFFLDSKALLRIEGTAWKRPTLEFEGEEDEDNNSDAVLELQSSFMWLSQRYRWCLMSVGRWNLRARGFFLFWSVRVWGSWI